MAFLSWLAGVVLGTVLVNAVYYAGLKKRWW